MQQENTYIEPSTIVKLSPAGDVISHGDSTPAKQLLGIKPQVPTFFQQNDLSSSVHAGLSPSLWGSPAEGLRPTVSATTKITMVKKNNSVNVGNKTRARNIFQEGALMEKQIDGLGLYTWEPRYMVLNVRRSGNKTNKKAPNDHINIWKLLPGSQSTVALRPTRKPTESIAIDSICYVRSTTSNGNKSRFNLEIKGGIIRSFIADSPKECTEWVDALQAVLKTPKALSPSPQALDGSENCDVEEPRVVRKILSGRKAPRGARSGHTKEWAIEKIVECVINKRSLYGAVMTGLPAFFKAIDRNKDGIISTKEFGEALSRLGLGLDDEQVEDISISMGSRKPGRNGNIKYVDFLRTLKDALTTSMKKQKVAKENQHKQKVNGSTHKTASRRESGKVQRTASAVVLVKANKRKTSSSKPKHTNASNNIITAANQSRQERILKRSQEIKSKSNKSSSKVKKVTVRMPSAPSVSNRSSRGSRRTRSKEKRLNRSAMDTNTISSKIKSHTTAKAKRANKSFSATYDAKANLRGDGSRVPSKAAKASSKRSKDTKPFSTKSKHGAKAISKNKNQSNSLGKKNLNDQPPPPPPQSTNTTLYAFRADIDRLNMALKEEKALNKLNLKHLSEMEETLKNERIEHSKMIESLNNTNKEKDEWNNSNLEKLHELYGKQIDKLQSQVEDLNDQLTASREDVCRLTMEVSNV